MLAISIFYLIVGYADTVIRFLGGKRSGLSISLYKSFRWVGWVMLVGAFLDWFYDSVFLMIFYVAILIFGIAVARAADALSNEGGKS